VAIGPVIGIEDLHLLFELYQGPSMKACIAVEVLLLATAALALPEIPIAKRHKTNGAHRVRKRQTVGTNVYDIITYSIGGAYYANGASQIHGWSWDGTPR
jgi:hypothetical protein